MVFIGAVAMRDAAGPFIPPTVSALLNSTLSNSTLVSANATSLHQGAIVKNATMGVATCQKGSCPYGLLNDMQVFNFSTSFFFFKF